MKLFLTTIVWTFCAIHFGLGIMLLDKAPFAGMSAIVLSAIGMYALYIVERDRR